jgi:hypothetical protein
MSANAQKSPSCSESQEPSLTIFDAPNVCRDFMAKCQSLAQHPDPEVAKKATEMSNDAKQMLDAIMASASLILAMEAQ